MSDRAPFEKRLECLEPNPLVTWGARAALALGPLLFVLSIAKMFPPGVFGIHVAIAGAALAVANARTMIRPKKRSALVRADDRGVIVDGKVAVTREAIADGYYQPRIRVDEKKPGSAVRFVDKRRRVLFEAETTEEEALAMLRALGLDPGSRRAVFNGSSPLYATFARNLLFIASLFVFTGAAGAVLGALHLHGALGLFPLVLVFASLGGMLPSKITIGVDGIHLRWLWSKQFIPMAEISSVLPESDRALRVVKKDGSHEIIYTAMRRRGSWGATSYATQHRDAVLARFREAQQAYESSGPVADISSVLARGTRTHEAWLGELGRIRKAMDGGGGYREVAMREEDLLKLVEDPRATEDARAGAALLLRGSLDDEKRTRIRVAAEASASPKLRVALDASASEDEEALLEAIGELSDDDDVPSAKRA